MKAALCWNVLPLCHALVLLLLSPVVVAAEQNITATMSGRDAHGAFETTDMFISATGRFRFSVPTLEVKGEVRTMPCAITAIPSNCEAIMLRGNVDITSVETNPFIKYLTIDDPYHRPSGYIELLMSKFPNLELFEYTDTNENEPPECVTGQYGRLDMRCFLRSGKLKVLNLLYNGPVTNLDSTLHNSNLDEYSLYFSVWRGSTYMGARPLGCQDDSCSCRRILNRCDVGKGVEIPRTDEYMHGLRTLSWKNAADSSVAVDDLPKCCMGLSFSGHFDFSRMPACSQVESFSWFGNDICSKEFGSLDFARFANLKVLRLCLNTRHMCEFDFAKIDAGGTLKCVDIVLSGGNVVRNFDSVFESERFKLVTIALDFRKQDMCK